MSIVRSQAPAPPPAVLAVSERPPPDESVVFATLMRQAEIALTSGFLPRAIRTAAQAVTIAMTGRELGLPVMTSLRLLSIIEGKPVFSAEGTLALVYQRVRGARVDVIESTDTCAEVEAQRPGGTAKRFAFTIDDARRAQLLQKDNWRKYPRTMLQWRAILNACRATFPDATLGLVTPDEAEEIAASHSPSVDPPAEPTRSWQEVPEPPTAATADGAAARLAARFAAEIEAATLAELPGIGAAIANAKAGEDGALDAAAVKALRASYAKRWAHLKKKPAGDEPPAQPDERQPGEEG